MSKKVNVTNTDNDNQNELNLGDGFKSENYLSSLQRENTYLTSQIKKLNDIVSKLKIQVTNFETEKKNLIQTSNKKENDLKEVKKKLASAKKEVENLKEKISSTEKDSQKNLLELKEQNSLLQKNKTTNQQLLVQLQNKITDLEFQMKSKESQKNFFTNSLIENQNIKLDIKPETFKKHEKFEGMGADVSYNIADINYQNPDLFITGSNELVEANEINENLKI